jgi:hypothetical protein
VGNLRQFLCIILLKCYKNQHLNFVRII